MISLAGLFASAVVTLVFYFAVVRKQADKKRRAAHLGFIALYALTLLLALRFGARTYPGVFVPSSKVLNWIFNGTTLFTVFGYGFAVLGAVAHAASLTLEGRISRALHGFRICLVSIATCISAYGFYFAAILQRLP